MERRRLAEDLYVLVATDLERRGFVAAFTERTGGVSGSPFDSLNLGFSQGDAVKRVRENRRRLINSLGVPPFASARQVHAAQITRVGPARAAAGFSDPLLRLPPSDGLAVTRPRLPVAQLTADCLPVVLASEHEGRLVTVHAGWRGLAAGILTRAASVFLIPGRTVAAIGPAIGPCHYEVGEDVARAVTGGSVAGAVTERRAGRIYLDLQRTAIRMLRAAGISRVERADLCTACEEARFFSHRRDGRTGRQAVIGMRL